MAQQEHQTANYRILIVDDDPAVLRTYALLMQRQGYAVTTANSAEYAQKLLAEGSFDLMLTDLAMEKWRSGFELIEFAKGRHPAMPALLITGYATPQVWEEAIKRRVRILLKPIDIPELMETVTEALMGRAGGAHGTTA